MADYRITYFLEDLGHQDMIVSLVKRVLANYHNDHITIHHDIRNARGGNVVLRALDQYLRELRANRHPRGNPDLLIITRDANRVGRVGREQELQKVITHIGYHGHYILALPEPYIEAWYFADPAAVQRVFKLRDLPIIPHEEPTRERYKQAFRQTLRAAGIRAPFGGTEYAEDIVREMDLYSAQRSTPALKRFVDDLSGVFHIWYGAG